MKNSPVIIESAPLGFPWQTVDPFLFCVHHDDAYPAGDERLAPPKASLAGRNIGMDFDGKDGWRMYHGSVVPGFPQHPHRGFETVSIVRRGFIDHSDSLGAAARFGQGDVQWMTAGKGIVHSEMFPLLNRDAGNPLELFQIWINLPAASKMVEPYFSMLWSETVPSLTVEDAQGKKAHVLVVAGRFADATAPSPPPDSWASDPKSDDAIWTIKREPGATLALPTADDDVNRALYFFEGDRLGVNDESLAVGRVAILDPSQPAILDGGPRGAEVLILQGRPIGEPVAQYGPFVMNTQAEIRQAFNDYQRTRFGGWPWPSDDPVHGRDEGRFARHPDGRVDRPKVG